MYNNRINPYYCLKIVLSCYPVKCIGGCETHRPAEYSDNISVKSHLRCEDETHKNVEAFAEHVFRL